jgi:hypothetical protein
MGWSLGRVLPVTVVMQDTSVIRFDATNQYKMGRIKAGVVKPLNRAPPGVELVTCSSPVSSHKIQSSAPLPLTFLIGIRSHNDDLF